MKSPVLYQTPTDVLTIEFIFDCPGCGCLHYFRTRSPIGDTWNWNGDMVKPTVTPSIVVDYKDHNRCHFFITNGRLEYQPDCTHDLKGETVDMEPCN